MSQPSSVFLTIIELIVNPMFKKLTLEFSVLVFAVYKAVFFKFMQSDFLYVYTLQPSLVLLYSIDC